MRWLYVTLVSVFAGSCPGGTTGTGSVSHQDYTFQNIPNSKFDREHILKSLLSLNRYRKRKLDGNFPGNLLHVKRAFEFHPQAVSSLKDYYSVGAKRFFQFSPLLSEVIKLNGPPTEFSTRTNLQPTVKTNAHVKPYVDHFSGLRSWGIPFYDGHRLHADNSKVLSKLQNTNAKSVSPDLSENPGGLSDLMDVTDPTLSGKHASASVQNTLSLPLSKLHSESLGTIFDEPKLNARSQWIDSSTSKSSAEEKKKEFHMDSGAFENKSLGDFDGGFKTFPDGILDILDTPVLGSNSVDGFGKSEDNDGFNSEGNANGFLSSQGDSWGFDSVIGDQPEAFGFGNFGDFSADERFDWEVTKPIFGSEFRTQNIGSSDVNLQEPHFLITQSEGTFNTDDKDCADIDTKTCITDDDCSCFGLYHCSSSTCKRFGSRSADEVWAPGSWHIAPVDERQ